MNLSNSQTLRNLALSSIAAGLIGIPVLAANLKPMDYEGGRSRDVVDRMERNSSAVATMIGELRTSTSDILFLKTERYLHSGVAYMPHMEDELLTVEGETHEMEHHQEEAAEQASDPGHHDQEDEHDDHAGTATMIRTPDDDFRGFVGYLHRQVKPWRPPELGHMHTDGTELLPWYRVMTLADPNNTRAYAIGGWWLKTHNLDEGIRFLQEGVENNPGSFIISSMLARLYDQKAVNLAKESGQSEETARLHKLSIEASIDAAEKGFAARPQGWTLETETEDWTRYTEDDFRGAMRLAVLYELRWGDPETALERARDYNERIGGDPILERVILREGGG